MSDVAGLPNGTPVEPPLKRGPGRPPKSAGAPSAPKPAADAAPPKSARKVKVVLRQPETVYVDPVKFERTLPVVMDMLAKVLDNGRLAVMTHAASPDSGKLLSAELGETLDVALLASGVELGPMEAALLNVGMLVSVMVAGYKSLPADLTYDAGVQLGKQATETVRASRDAVGTPPKEAPH